MFKSISLAVTTLLLVTGCSAATEKVSLDQLEHVHSVKTDGENFYLASHHGLFVWESDSWSLLGEEFDVMGLAMSDGVLYASGHPGPNQDLADPLGILSSTDGGETWESKTFAGEVDFHLLEVSGDSFIGAAANYGVIVGSQDATVTWKTIETPNLTSMSLNPKNGKELLIAAEGLLLLSKDSGATFVEFDAPSSIAHVDWSNAGIYLGTDQQLFFSSDLNQGFSSNPAIFNNIKSVSAQGKQVIVLDEDGVHISEDAGASFRLLP